MVGVNTQKHTDPKTIHPKWLDKSQGKEAENMLAKGLIHIAYKNFCQEGKRRQQPALLFLKLRRNTGGIAGTTDL